MPELATTALLVPWSGSVARPATVDILRPHSALRIQLQQVHFLIVSMSGETP